MLGERDSGDGELLIFILSRLELLRTETLLDLYLTEILSLLVSICIPTLYRDLSLTNLEGLFMI
jgi:hypothetical protein